MTPMTTPCTCTVSAATMIGATASLDGLQADVAILPVESLQGHLGAFQKRDHHLAVPDRLPVLDDHQISVSNLFVDHRVTPNPQGVGVTRTHKVLRHGDCLVAHHRFNRNPGGDISQQRQIKRSAAHWRLDQFDGPAPVPRPSDDPLVLEVGQVLVHRGERRQTEASADLFQTRGIAVLFDEFVQVGPGFPAVAW